VPSEGTDLLIPNPEASLYTEGDPKSVYFLLGMMCARAIIDRVLLGTKFAKIYLRGILSKKNGINQLASYDNQLYNQLRKVKEIEEIENVIFI